MPGASFPNPKTISSVSANKDLIVTDYGTIKGDKHFKEQTIDEFIKKIEKSIELCYMKLDDNTYEHSIKYDTKVIDNENDNYYIVIDDEDYNLKLNVKSKYYPILKNKLNELAKESETNIKEENTINDLEKNINLEEHNNQDDLQAYLNFLTNCRKKYSNSFLINTFLVGFLNSIFLIMFIAFLSSCSDILSKSIIIIFYLVFEAYLNYFLYEKYEIITKSFKINKIIKAKINGLTNRLSKLRKINIKINSELADENKEEKDIYKETIINYMSSIMNCANKLKNKKESHVILISLRDILDEYTSRMQEYNANNDKGLTLVNDKQVIMQEIIEKLVTLEMKIAEIKKRDDANKLINDDSDVLREKISGYIDATSDRQLEHSHKVHARTMQ